MDPAAPFPDDHTGQVWIGGPEVAHLLPLDRARAIHYFMASPFCDPACNNWKAWQSGQQDPAVPGVLK